jgi:hypothetical protein
VQPVCYVDKELQRGGMDVIASGWIGAAPDLIREMGRESGRKSVYGNPEALAGHLAGGCCDPENKKGLIQSDESSSLDARDGFQR